MNKETQLVLDIWEVFRDILPASKRADAAIDMLTKFEDFGLEGGEIASIVDEDPTLRDAFAEVYPDEASSHDEDEL